MSYVLKNDVIDTIKCADLTPGRMPDVVYVAACNVLGCVPSRDRVERLFQETVAALKLAVINHIEDVPEQSFEEIARDFVEELRDESEDLSDKANQLEDFLEEDE